MAVIKRTWNELLTNKPVLTKAEYDSLFADIDELLNSKVDEGLSISLMKGVYDDVVDSYLTVGDSNLWKDLPIFLSSFKLNDRRIFNLIRLKLLQYLGFYKRILTDDGIVRSVITHRSYSDGTTSQGINRSQFSETPQIDVSSQSIPSFDDTLDYLSNVSKSSDDIETSREGESDLSVSSKTWDEEQKNLNMVFYNTLCEYVSRIPEMIYNYYSLDSYPIPEVIGESINYYKGLRDIYECR